MATEHVHCLASVEIPYSYVPIASTTHECITIRRHGPHAHNVALQATEMLAMRTEDMDLSIVQSDDNVVGSQVQRRDHTLIGCDGVRR